MRDQGTGGSPMSVSPRSGVAVDLVAIRIGVVGLDTGLGQALRRLAQQPAQLFALLAVEPVEQLLLDLRPDRIQRLVQVALTESGRAVGWQTARSTRQTALRGGSPISSARQRVPP